jgi:hypothetical protein
VLDYTFLLEGREDGVAKIMHGTKVSLRAL